MRGFRYAVVALFYLYSPLITTLPDLETALHFSMVTFTGVGYGDVVLTGSWRILASIQAANGVIMLGWTTESDSSSNLRMLAHLGQGEPGAHAGVPVVSEQEHT